MELFHGSNVNIEKPELSYSSKTKDFGKGFYLTSDFEQAKIWSEKKTTKLGNGEPIVSKFKFDDTNMSDLKVKIFEIADENWFDYVMSNRKNINYNDDYDLVIGPVANDGTYEVINLFTRGILSKEQAIFRLKTFKLKNQYTFKTDKALKYLIYEGELR